MTVKELTEKTGWKLLTDGLNEQITAGFVCDLLSWAMARVQTGTAWITVQAHVNVVAVAALTGCACVIIPENIAVSEEVLATARDKEVMLISAPCSSYGAALVLAQLGFGEVPPT